MEYALSLISIDNIMELPWMVKGPGLLIIFLFLMRFIRSLFSLHLVTAFTSLVYAFVFSLILSQGGSAIVQLMGIEEEPGTQALLYHAISAA